jgi:hypothetical protein
LERERIFHPDGIGGPDLPAHIPVAIPTTLSWLLLVTNVFLFYVKKRVNIIS